MVPKFSLYDGRSYYVFLLLKYFKRNGHNVFLCTDNGDSFERLSRLEIPFFTFDYLSDRSSMIKSLKSISSIIMENNIQILHTHHRYFEFLSNLLKSRNKFSTVSTVLSLVDKRFLIEYKSDRMIAVSKTVRNMLIEKFKVDPGRINLIPNFVDSEELNLNGESKYKDSDCKNKTGIQVLSVGRFHKEKNYETLLKALSLLKNCEIKLTLIGRGKEESNYRKIIEENSLNVEIIAPQNNLKTYFDTADICVLTSVRDPLPTFMLQSGLHKKPFIGSNVDGISELIIDKQNGLLFEKENPPELANKIMLFMEDRELANTCAHSLNKEITAKFTEKTVIPEIEQLYFKLMQ